MIALSVDGLTQVRFFCLLTLAGCYPQPLLQLLRSLPPYCSPSLIKFEFTSTYLLGWEPISYRNHHSPSHEIKDSQFSFANFGFSSGTKYNSKLVDKLTSLKIRFVLRTRTKQHVTLATLDLKHVVMLSTVTLALERTCCHAYCDRRCS